MGRSLRRSPRCSELDRCRSEDSLVKIATALTSQAEVNAASAKAFLYSGGMVLDETLVSELGLVPFYKVQSLLSSRSFRCMDTEGTQALLQMRPRALLALGRNPSYYIPPTLVFAVAAQSMYDPLDRWLARICVCSPSHLFLFVGPICRVIRPCNFTVVCSRSPCPLAPSKQSAQSCHLSTAH